MTELGPRSMVELIDQRLQPMARWAPDDLGTRTPTRDESPILDRSAGGGIDQSDSVPRDLGGAPDLREVPGHREPEHG